MAFQKGPRRALYTDVGEILDGGQGPLSAAALFDGLDYDLGRPDREDADIIILCRRPRGHGALCDVGAPGRDRPDRRA